MKQIYFKCLGMILLSMITFAAYAQKVVSGTVSETSGEGIPGVTVTEKGTSNGVSTDANGKFALTVKPGATLVVRSIGYTTQEIAVGESSTINVTLQEDNTQLSEVVVTALGIRRERKSLGYAVQEVKGETLVEAREPNLVNALSGKVAGLQVTRSSNGPMGSSRITLRGNNSLSKLPGSNQPLIVVDGVPVSNFTGSDNNDFYNPAPDYGNGLADINAEDIENISVLKGPSAAALYGSRAGNGAILITTKSGRAQSGLGINVSSSVGIERIFTGPDLQDAFGQGANGVFDALSNISWGPKIEGQNLAKWNGVSAPLSAYDNIGNYFGNGTSSNQSISFQQQFKSTSVYTSYNRADDKSIIPGAKLTRNNLMARAVSKFGADDRWTTDTKIQYGNTRANNRPIVGNRSENSFSTLYNLPRSLDIRDFSAAKNDLGRMLWYGGGNQINPYWNRQYNLNEDTRDRFLMTGSLNYKFNEWLTAEVRGGADIYSTNYENWTYAGSPVVNNGRYSEGKRTFTETNFSTLFTARKDNLFGKLGGAATLGGNLMSQEMDYLTASSGEFVVPNYFAINNGVNNPVVEQKGERKKINSVYGSLQVNYDQYLFLEGTMRNDWSSALSEENRSYFYPSVSTSFVFSEMISRNGGTMPSWMSFGKLRASYAEVGNDLPPYQLYNTYDIAKDPNGNTVAYPKEVYYDPMVRSELIKSFEVGAEMRFFNSRFGFDVAYYKSNATRQLIEIPMDPLSGYKFRKINAGDIENKGFEAMVDGRLLQAENGLNWNMSVNYSTNKNSVNKLIAGVPLYPLGGYDNVQINANEGELFGNIYGNTYLRVQDEQSPYFGQLILTPEGLPREGPRALLGNQQATGLLGVTNSFAYKGIGLSFLVDARFGGKIFSATNALMQENGTAAITAPNGQRENFVVPGVIETGSGFTPNTTAVSQQLYWQQVHSFGNLGIAEENIYDATNVRLRNVQLSYTLPKSLLAKTPVQRAKVGFSVNNVWLISGDMNGIDPESIYNTGTTATGFESFSAPTTRTFLFNLTVGF
ncbi:SusC/RagA family TonB-linked outer membrane protein [Pedobacter deserti]|uniref:SusC/RagA family TonB-linked outer membrane protein n=1 Tax=Pedobacter deserti TaxID=2817382 RepID=UPI00210A5B1B|nr:SusC/RagA family TonB-linked outer membrane protein [Pedobacter sp. SYSU D00382]